MENKLLNAPLYRQLARHFGQVKIEKQGQPLQARAEMQDERQTLDIYEGGETYRVCCPVCGDSKFHLYVSHAFGTIDEVTGIKIRFAKCFRHGKVVKYLEDKLRWMSIKSQVINHTANAISAGVEDPYRDPGECINIAQEDLRLWQIRKYLSDRGIDPGWVGRTYGWRFCVQGSPDVLGGGCTNRLIVPVIHNGQEVGWQARLAFDPGQSHLNF